MLSRDEQVLFRRSVERLNEAYDAHRRMKTPGHPQWPASLRIKPVSAAPGIWEITWSFSGPDGRATFEFVNIDGELAIRWRRIGGHAIFRAP